MADLLERIKKDRGLGGRLRTESDVRERVRIRVTNAFARVLKEIGANDRALAAHLRSPTLKRGFNPCYSPPEPIDWELA